MFKKNYTFEELIKMGFSDVEIENMWYANVKRDDINYMLSSRHRPYILSIMTTYQFRKKVLREYKKEIVEMVNGFDASYKAEAASRLICLNESMIESELGRIKLLGMVEALGEARKKEDADFACKVATDKRVIESSWAVDLTRMASHGISSATIYKTLSSIEKSDVSKNSFHTKKRFFRKTTRN